MWVKLDDNLPDNPKVDQLSDGAFRLYVSGLCYAQRHLTDGNIQDNRVARLTPRFEWDHVNELVESGLWQIKGSGYLIHDFVEWNNTREHWVQKRKSDAKRKADWREKKRGGDGRYTP